MPLMTLLLFLSVSYKQDKKKATINSRHRKIFTLATKLSRNNLETMLVAGTDFRITTKNNTQSVTEFFIFQRKQPLSFKTPSVKRINDICNVYDLLNGVVNLYCTRVEYENTYEL